MMLDTVKLSRSKMSTSPGAAVAPAPEPDDPEAPVAEKGEVGLGTGEG